MRPRAGNIQLDDVGAQVRLRGLDRLPQARVARVVKELIPFHPDFKRLAASLTSLYDYSSIG